MARPSRLTPEQWAEVDAAISAGDLPLSAIAKDHGIAESTVRKRIETRGLVRSLKSRVAKRAEAKLLAATVNGVNRAELVQELRTITADLGDEAEEAAIEATAEALAVIIGRQRHESHRAKALVDRLIEDLTAAVMHRDAIEALIDDETQEVDEDGKPTRVNSNRRNAMNAAVSLPSQAKAAAQLVNALRTVQDIERRAWGIADDTAPAKPQDEKPGLVQGIESLALAWKDRHKQTPPA